MAVTYRKVLKYTLLPGFIPRLRGLFTAGFVHISFCMALVYQAVRLLPPDHPYLDPRNMGRFGIRHVIAEAANNLVISRKNIDQVAVFFLILAGISLLLAQLVLLIVAFVAQQPALAAIVPSIQNIVGVASIYGHGGPGDQDVAFIILDRVFGLVGIYDSCISTGAQCTDLNGNNLTDPGAAYPFATHLALHGLLQFYTLGIFIVSIIVIIYFVITIVGETAVTGSPFGQRFNHTWGPVRLIMFFALLVPLNIGGQNAGLNGAQLATFWSAKLGSNFATNAWGYFNGVLTGTYLGQTADLVAVTNFPEVNSLVRFMFVAMTCKITEEYAYNEAYQPDGIQAYIVRDALSNGLFAGNNWMELNGTSFTQARDFANNGNIEIRFGVRKDNDEEYALERGHVKPFCGTLTVPITSLDTPGAGVPGSQGVQQLYYEMIQQMWQDPQIVENAACIRNKVMQLSHEPGCTQWPDFAWAQGVVEQWQNYIRNNIPPLLNQQVNNSDWGVSPRLLAAGWAGAAIWYNRIAQVNGEWADAVMGIPFGNKFPYLMEAVSENNRAANSTLNAEDSFDPSLGKNTESEYPRTQDRMIAAVLYNAYKLWERTGADRSHAARHSDNAFSSGVNSIFGTEGIFSMRDNPTIHPLARLSAMGKSMMDAALRNMAVGLVAGGVGGILKKAVGEGAAGVTQALGDFLLAMGKTLLLMAFILYYVLPFLPFIYFMFAVSGWVKSIFEAVVAMPLWALSHITRMDGQGMPGPGANNGYFLILEIFLRPILILFGLLASISIFSALVNGLDEVFDLVVVNVTGFDREADAKGPTQIEYYRSSIDQFFFSVIYVIICYMMANSMFKMVDQVPNQILRWMGVSVTTFSEAAGDPAGELTGKIYAGGQMALGQVRSGGQLAALIGVTG